MSEELEIKIRNYLVIADSLENTFVGICTSCPCGHCPLYNNRASLAYNKALCNKTQDFLESVAEYRSKNG